MNPSLRLTGAIVDAAIPVSSEGRSAVRRSSTRLAALGILLGATVLRSVINSSARSTTAGSP